jgi:hypothetical protein
MELKRVFFQACEQNPARISEENQRVTNGVQVHGEHQRLPGQRPCGGRPRSRDLPDCRPLGEAEPQLSGHLPAVAWPKGICKCMLGG